MNLNEFYYIFNKFYVADDLRLIFYCLTFFCLVSDLLSETSVLASVPR